MKPPRRNFLSILDNTVRWTGIPARVTGHMSAAASVDRKYRPLRWIPIWPIACSCVLFLLSFSRPSALLGSLGAVILAMVPSIHANGPLGKPWHEDDEREAALRKDSFLFCLGLLVFLNCVGQMILVGLYLLQNWQSAHVVSAQVVIVAMSALMLNMTLFGCLPTLYASWKLPGLLKD